MIVWTNNWDNPLCANKCMQLAECEVDGEPWCLQCLEDWLERIEAIAMFPHWNSILPPLDRFK